MSLRLKRKNQSKDIDLSIKIQMITDSLPTPYPLTPTHSPTPVQNIEEQEKETQEKPFRNHIQKSQEEGDPSSKPKKEQLQKGEEKQEQEAPGPRAASVGKQLMLTVSKAHCWELSKLRTEKLLVALATWSVNVHVDGMHREGGVSWERRNDWEW